MQTDDNELTPKARAWIDAIRGQFQGIPLAPAGRRRAPARRAGVQGVTNLSRRMDAALTFTAIQEPEPCEAALSARCWPALEAWYLRDGDAARPTYVAARRALQQHMPELVPTWEALCERAGGGDVAARVLSLYDPPPLLAGCSQAVIGGALVRNYDYHPDRIEGDDPRQRDHAAGARDERLPVGPARRRQRRRPGGRAGVRRPARARARVRRSRSSSATCSRPATRSSRRDARSRACRCTRRTTSRSRTRTATPRPSTSAPTVPRASCCPRSRPTTRSRSTGPSTRSRRARSSATPSCLPRPPRPTRGAFLEPPLYATEFERGFGTLYTAVYRPRTARQLPLAGPARACARPSTASLRRAASRSGSPASRELSSARVAAALDVAHTCLTRV